MQQLSSARCRGGGGASCGELTKKSSCSSSSHSLEKPSSCEISRHRQSLQKVKCTNRFHDLCRKCSRGRLCAFVSLTRHPCEDMCLSPVSLCWIFGALRQALSMVAGSRSLSWSNASMGFRMQEWWLGPSLQDDGERTTGDGLRYQVGEVTRSWVRQRVQKRDERLDVVLAQAQRF